MKSQDGMLRLCRGNCKKDSKTSTFLFMSGIHCLFDFSICDASEQQKEPVDQFIREDSVSSLRERNAHGRECP